MSISPTTNITVDNVRKPIFVGGEAAASVKSY